LIRSPRRPRKTNRWPLCGSRFSVSCTTSAKPGKPFLMSVWPVASHTRTPFGTGIIATQARPARAEAPRYPHRDPRGRAAAAKFDLDDAALAAPSAGRGRWRWHTAGGHDSCGDDLHRDQLRGAGVDPIAQVLAPSKELADVECSSIAQLPTPRQARTTPRLDIPFPNVTIAGASRPT
jgi:hypothetical protein